MRFKDFFEETRNTFKTKLNPFLHEEGLRNVRVLSSALRVLEKPLSLAVYPTSESGSTAEDQNGRTIVRFCVEFFCNQDATERGLEDTENYYSALYSFLENTEFGEYHQIADSIISRMDEGRPANGCIFLIESRINTLNDFGW